MTESQIIAELKVVKSELASLRKILRQIVPVTDGELREPRAVWVDFKKAMAMTELTQRQLRHRLQAHDDMKRVKPGIGVQVNITAFNNYYAS